MSDESNLPQGTIPLSKVLSCEVLARTETISQVTEGQLHGRHKLFGPAPLIIQERLEQKGPYRFHLHQQFLSAAKVR